MEDKLKAFVGANRDEFESHEPNVDLLWENIQTGLTDKAEKTKNSHRAWMKIAASIALLIVFSISFFYMMENDQVEQNVFASNPELAEAQLFYTSQIDQKMTIARTRIQNKAMLSDIEELDRAFAELQEDLKDNADNEEVIIAMIENYQLKLKILDRILKELKEEEVEHEQL